MSKIAELEELDSGSWDAMVLASPDANPYQLCGWRLILTDVFGVKPVYRAIRNTSGDLDAVVPAYLSKPVLGTCHISTMEGGIIGPSSQHRNLLVDEIEKTAQIEGARYVLLKGGARGSRPTTVRSKRVFPVLSLAGGEDEVMQGLSKKMRYQVRKALELPLQCEHRDTPPAEFYGVFSTVQKNLGTPVVPAAFFDAMGTHLRPYLHFVGLYNAGVLVAGMVGMKFGTCFYSLYAATRADFQARYANYNLYGRVIEWACENGFVTFNLGRSVPGSPAHQFKRKWRANESEVDYCQLSIASGDFSRDSSGSGDAAQALVSNVWRHLPLTVANWLGPKLRRQRPFG